MNSEKSYLQLSTYQAGMIQSRAFRALTNFLNKQLEDYNLSLSEWKLLGQILDRKQMTPTELAEVLGIKIPICSRLLKELEVKGLIIKKVSPNDKRAYSASLSKKGVQAVTTIEKDIRVKMGGFLSDINRQELEVYLSVLYKIANKINQ